MSQALPFENIRFCDAEETARVSNEFFSHAGKNLASDAFVGYALEVDLSIPPELSDYFSLFPPLAEKRLVKANEYSPHTRDIAKKYGLKEQTSEKLMTDLNDKRGYPIHYRNLKFVLSLGVKLEKIHRVVQFHQKPWLAPYIEINSSHRAKATNKFTKDFFKLLNNRFVIHHHHHHLHAPLSLLLSIIIIIIIILSLFSFHLSLSPLSLLFLSFLSLLSAFLAR